MTMLFENTNSIAFFNLPKTKSESPLMQKKRPGKKCKGLFIPVRLQRIRDKARSGRVLSGI